MPNLIPEHLHQQIKSGRVVIVLGAGASVTSTNRYGKKLKLAYELAAEIASKGGFSYSDDSMTDVLEAARPILGDSELRAIFENNFLNCKPSDELSQLFSYCWRRVYTFNIDDAIRNVPRKFCVQHFKPINALKGKREDPRGYSECQLIYLHGFVGDFSDGFVFSASDYAKKAASGIAWYEHLGEDFYNYTIVFIGTKLDEPLLFQHINTVLSEHDIPGISYLVTPGQLSEIKKKSLENRHIKHIAASLRDFVRELQSLFPSAIKPSEIESDSAAGDISDLSRFSQRDVEALRSIFPISRAHLQKRIHSQDKAKAARRFFEGYGPSWKVVLEKIYANLLQYDRVLNEFDLRFSADDRYFVILGEAGSGKSTCAMHVALRFAEKHRATNVFEYKETNSSLKEVLLSLKKYSRDERCVLLLDDLHVYIDEISELVGDSNFSFATILSSGRFAEWQSRIGKQLPPRAGSTATLRRFENVDIPEIIEKIKTYFAAPAFLQLTTTEQTRRFERSKRQLLIALKEATESRGFDEIIEDEFASVKERDARVLFHVIGIATIARTGIIRPMAESIYKRVAEKVSFRDAIQENLSGMVDLGDGGRLLARHEVYARHVFRKGAFDEKLLALQGILDYFTTFEMPVIRNVSKLDGQIFKYILNNKFIYDFFDAAERRFDAIEFYDRFATKLQLDGHYWLQYGLLLRRLGRQVEAYDRFQKSIQAYPASDYAQHALAQQKLITAAFRNEFDAECRALVDEAVEYLMERHYRTYGHYRNTATDEYPLVTLSYYHIDTLVKHGKEQETVQYAKKYFQMIQEVEKLRPNELLADVKPKLALYSVHREWRPLHYRGGEISYFE
jgi:SIR2-like domain